MLAQLFPGEVGFNMPIGGGFSRDDVENELTYLKAATKIVASRSPYSVFSVSIPNLEPNIMQAPGPCRHKLCTTPLLAKPPKTLKTEP